MAAKGAAYIRKRVKIRGQYWYIVVGRPPTNLCDGLCRPSERSIYIRPSADRIETVIHEVLHACLGDLGENAIIKTEETIVAALNAVA